MCGICMRTPCHSRCPNAPEPPIVHRCIHCNAPIVEGEDYYDVDGEPWCEDCMKKCHKTAEVDD